MRKKGVNFRNNCENIRDLNQWIRDCLGSLENGTEVFLENHRTEQFILVVDSLFFEHQKRRKKIVDKKSKTKNGILFF